MQLKNSGINAALLRRCEANTRLLPDVLANSACRGIAFKAADVMNETARVAPSTVDSELNASVASLLVKIKSGKRWSRNKKNRARFFGPVGKGAHPDVPLAALIINASVRSDSNYNLRTGNVYQRAMSPFKGKSRAAGAQAMLEAMRRMTAARRSATGFFWACARAVNVGFGIALGKINGARWVPNEDNPNAGGDINKISKLLSKGLAQITPAQNGSGRAGFSVATTEPDTKGTPGHALERIAQPIWQAAVDDEARFQESKVRAAYVNAIEDAGITVS